MQRYGSQAGSEDRASKVVTDAAGDIIVAGSAGKQIGSDLRVIKYSGAGVRLWAKRYNGPVNDYDEPSAMAVDGNGNVFVSGYSLASGGQ
ncbi:MAG: SBBP repeat-containing protein [Verrucomicrobiota bacterium]